MTGKLTAIGTVTAGLVLVLGAAPASADMHTQPADTGNVANIDRGNSAEGPHCHYVLPARGKGPFANIVTAAAHQGHTETGTPTGIFEATSCPS